jgi:hypothetical protein
MRGFDILIQGGQSNGVGRGVGKLIWLTDDRLDRRIFQIGRFGDEDRQIIPAFPRLHFRLTKPEPFNNRHTYAFSLARLYAAEYLEEGRSVLIIPAAEVGSSSERWLGNLYEDMADRIRLALAQEGENRIIWYSEQQGEWDAEHTPKLNIAAGVARFKANKLAFLEKLRSDFGDIPAMLGGFVPAWAAKREWRRQTEAAIREVCASVPNCAYVPTEGLKGVPQMPVHFTSMGLEFLAKRHFAAFQSLRGYRSATPT